MDKNIITREYREGDEISIMKLRGLVLTGSKDMDWWVWQHRQNPAGEAIITIAETEDVKNEYRIIGHQASLPLRVKINNDIRYIFTTVDTMNHPGYRGLGIYSELRRMRLEIAKQRNYLFAYSFPNLDMRPINRKQQAKLISKKTPMWIKILKVSNISIKYLSNVGIFTDLVKVVGGGLIRIADRLTNRQIHTEVREIDKIDDRFDILWQQASSHHKIMLVRDRAYLEWRYIKKPDANYKF